MTDRRQVLQMGALVAVALVGAQACSDDNPSGPGTPPPTPDAQQSEELALIAAYDAAILAAAPARVAEYQRIRDEHAAHLRALGWEQAPAPGASAAPAVSRKALRRAEAAASRSHGRAAVSATDPEQAQILCLIAASEAQHAAILAAT